MERKPFISVVIPVKNGGREFEQCLQGLRTSNYKNYELIVVNDASKDDSLRIAMKYGCVSQIHLYLNILYRSKNANFYQIVC